MKILKVKFLALTALLAVIVSACSVSDNDRYCFNQYYTQPAKVEGPTSVVVNAPLTLTVTYVPLGTCGEFNRFTETTEGNTKEIKLLVNYEGCECPQTTQTRTEPYKFTATTPGEYSLVFLTADPTKPIVKTITVTAE